MNLDFNPERMYAQGMDTCHACLIEVYITASWFDQYEITGSHLLGINCELLGKVIGCLEEDQEIQLSLDNGEDRLVIQLMGENTTQKEFSIPLMDIEAELMTIPEQEYEADIDIPADKFKELIGQLAIFSETVEFHCDEEGIQLVAKGDSGQMTVKLKEEHINRYAVEEDCDLVVSYGTRFLEKASAFAKLSPDVSIHCSRGQPMKIQYCLDDPPEETELAEADREPAYTNYMRFFLAPKIEE